MFSEFTTFYKQTETQSEALGFKMMDGHNGHLNVSREHQGWFLLFKSKIEYGHAEGHPLMSVPGAAGSLHVAASADSCSSPVAASLFL